MAKNSNIGWTHHTFNPWVGCAKISPACDNCYAEGWAKRSGMVEWGSHAERRRTKPGNWNQPLKWNAEAERLGVRYRVFCSSLADVFDNAVPDEWRQDLLRLIASTQNLDWLLLTKRIGNAEKMLSDMAGRFGMTWGDHWRNVWIGATVCNQDEANRDIPKLLKVPAAKRFLSMEPLLGPVNLRSLALDGGSGFDALVGGPVSANDLPGLDWVIVGGESGPHARPAHPDWVRFLRDQCVAADVPFFFKQWGEYANADAAGLDLNLCYESSRRGGWIQANGEACFGENAAPIDSQASHLFHLGTKRTGHLLDGCTWELIPNSQSI